MSSIVDDIRYGFMRRHGAIGEIIVVNVGVFLTVMLAQLFLFLAGSPDGILGGFILEWLALPAAPMAFLERPWTLFSYIFLHQWTGIFHLLFNMLWLYWIGRLLREYQGDRKVWSTFFLGGIAAGLFYMIIENALPALRGAAANDRLIGASGGVTAVIVATATLLPDYGIGLLFFGVVRLKWIAVIMVALDVLFLPAGNTGGRLAHLGGALYGYLYIVSLKRGTDLAQPFNWLVDTLREAFTGGGQPRRPKPKVRTVRNQNVGKGGRQGAAGSSGAPSQDEVDRILEKINRVGYDGLTKEEKQILFNASK